MITLTSSAAEHLKKMAEDNAEPGQVLRFFVDQGCCMENQYGMGFDQAKEDDRIIESEGLKMAVDPESWKLLCGAHIDYKNDEQEGWGFEITNPNARKSCGCGKSFE